MDGAPEEDVATEDGVSEPGTSGRIGVATTQGGTLLLSLDPL